MASWTEGLYAALPTPLQNLACTWAGYRRARLRFGPHFRATLASWQRQVPLDSLVEIQRQRLVGLVERARRTTDHYRELPPASNAADPRRAIADTLAQIPVLEKTEYRARPETFLCSDVPPSDRILGRTSGTTGTALPLWFTPRAVAEEFASVWRQRIHFGADPSDANLTFNGQLIVPFAQSRPPFWRTNYYGRQTLFSLYHMNPENLGAYVEAAHATPALWVQGYPSAIFLVARAMLEANRPLPEGRLRAVFTSSESLLAFQRDTIERAFGAPVRDRYGVGEFAVSMTECEERALHVDMEFGIVEVEAREETADYERGDLIVTGFANDATPWIRYRVGDIGTRSKQPCPCGRPGDVFLEIDGRNEDYVATPDGRLVGRLDHIFKGQLDVAEAQVQQETPQAIEVRIVPQAGYNAASERKLLQEIRLRLGEEIDVRLRLVDAIPREPNGKFRAVKSRVGKALLEEKLELSMPGAEPGTADIVSYFDRESSGWSARYASATQFPKRLRIVLSWVDAEDRTDRMLDYGCGSGVFARELVKRGSHVTCVDASPRMLDIARASMEDLDGAADRVALELVQGDDFRGRYLGSAYDGIICLGVLEYVEKDDLLMERLASCLRPGGFLIVSVPNRRSILRGIERFVYHNPAPFRRMAMFRHLTEADSYLRYQRHRYTLAELDRGFLPIGLRRERECYSAAPGWMNLLEDHARIGFNLVALYRRPPVDRREGSEESPA